MSAPYTLSLKLSWGENTCLWAGDGTTADRYGYAIDPERLPLSRGTCAEVAHLCDRFYAHYTDIWNAEEDPRALMLGYEDEADVFAPAVMRLAERLRTELGEAFVVEHDFTPVPAFRVGWDRRWAAFASVASVVMAVLVAAMAVWIARPPAAYEPMRAGVLIVAFAAFALLFASTAVTYALAAFDEGDVLVIDWRGVTDRRLSRDRIDWAGLSQFAVVDGAIVLKLTQGEGRSVAFPANPLWATVRFCARFSGPGEFKLKPIGLATTAVAILAALEREGGA